MPFPDTRAIEYPEQEAWQRLSERRIERYGNADYLFDRDEKTKAILGKLNEQVSMNYNDTPLEDVVKYVQAVDPERGGRASPTGIPIYIDKLGLQDADKTTQDKVSINLEEDPAEDDACGSC